MANHPEQDTAASIDDVLATALLAQRPARAPDYAAENRALLLLAREMARDPRAMLQKLAELVLELCRAESAGISVLEPGAQCGVEPGNDAGGDCSVFRWWAAAGAFAGYLGSTMARRATPCSTVITRNSLLLFDQAERVFPALRGVEPRCYENLLAPWAVDGQPVGTVWAIQHHPERHFDAEDARLLVSLSAFASAAWQMNATLDDLRAVRAELEQRVAERTEALSYSVVQLEREAEQRRQAEQARQNVETGARDALRRHSRFTEATLSSIPDGVYTVDREHRIAYANRAMHDLFGIEPGRMAGRFFAELGFQLEQVERIDRHLDAVFAIGVTVEDEILISSPAGAQAYCQFRWGPIPADDGTIELVVGVSRDTTERRRLERRLRDSEERTTFLLRLSDALRPLNDAAAIEETSARLLGRHLGLNRVLIGEFVGDEVVIERDWVDGVATMAGRYPRSDLIHIMLGYYARGEAFVTADLAHDPRVEAHELATWAPGGIGALVSVGLLGNSHVMANFCVQNLAPRAWSEDEVNLVREVAERAWAAMERARAEQALKDADRRKDEFLATLAHELRNPLAPISNAVHLLRRPDGRRVTDRLMEVVERQVRQIVKLVDDLMEISRITRGKIELERHPVELAAAMRDAVESSRPLVERARHHLSVDLPPGPLLLDADSVRLIQILTNLINNAAKYTEPGGRIWLSAERNGAQVAIRVRDNGLGIARDQLVRVFEMFAQAHDPALRGGEGLGIGLALVRKLVEMHGGTVEAHSAGLGQGSEFVVRLPLIDEEDARQDDLPTARVALQGLRILVVDDNRDAADTLALLLESHGATVQAVYDGETALEALAHFPADSVLLDLGMPGMDGLEVARRIRLDPRLAQVRLLALTGWGQQADRERTRAAGFDHHLTKPVDFAALEAWLTER